MIDLDYVAVNVHLYLLAQGPAAKKGKVSLPAACERLAVEALRPSKHRPTNKAAREEQAYTFGIKKIYIWLFLPQNRTV